MGKKRQEKFKQLGRSMIEMLGVLAIIGVLSVGGIAGYTKAIDMYRSNIQKRQLNSLFTQAVTLNADFQRQALKNPSETIRLIQVLDALGELPDGMTTPDGFCAFDIDKTQICADFRLFPDSKIMDNYFYVVFKPSSNSLFNNITRRSCVNLLTTVQRFAANVWRMEMRRGGSGSEFMWSADINNLPNVTLAEWNQKCKICDTSQCRVFIYLKPRHM